MARKEAVATCMCILSFLLLVGMSSSQTPSTSATASQAVVLIAVDTQSTRMAETMADAAVGNQTAPDLTNQAAGNQSAQQSPPPPPPDFTESPPMPLPPPTALNTASTCDPARGTWVKDSKRPAYSALKCPWLQVRMGRWLRGGPRMEK